jgi:hypothetical protein
MLFIPFNVSFQFFGGLMLFYQLYRLFGYLVVLQDC